MQPDRDLELLADIVLACRHALRHVDGMTRASFEDDIKTQDAVIRRISIIGEAASHLSPEFRGQWPTVPWNEIRGMRNILIHSYRNIDVDEVWQVCTVDIVGLLDSLDHLVPDLD